MTEWMIANESPIRFGVFIGLFALLAAVEFRHPLRQPVARTSVRWGINLGLAFLGAFFIRFLFPAAAVGFAIFAQSHGLGLLRVWNPDPLLGIVLSVVLLDLAIYFQHVVFHYIPVLWRFHRVHHADIDFDVTTAMRFHPIELLISMTIKGLLICLIGPPVVAVMLFEVLLNASSLFTHANIRLPNGLDRLLRVAIVTPDMHRIHHSIEPIETNSNFGFNISVWDRLFGTYRREAHLDQRSMPIGVGELRDPHEMGFFDMLKLPFQRQLVQK
jgi:sterol desaturase/sphingolipid hydroxylase (fatty acid hydroxylase superfamily)